jgi:hypothetical protein
VPASFHPRKAEAATVDIAPDDPIVAHFLSAAGAVEVDKLHLDSPALIALRSADVKLAVPLVSQGELVGLLTLGPRLSEQQYSAYDRQLLNTLAIQAAPAVRVAQMVREQQAAIRERERLDHELRVARLIQQTLLPKDLPTLPGWQLAAYYQSASAVGGDFYDFLAFEDGGWVSSLGMFLIKVCQQRWLWQVHEVSCVRLRKVESRRARSWNRPIIYFARIFCLRCLLPVSMLFLIP